LVNDSAVRKWQRHHRAAVAAAASQSDASSGNASSDDDLHAALAAEQNVQSLSAVPKAKTLRVESRLWFRHNPYGCYDIFIVKPVRA